MRFHTFDGRNTPALRTPHIQALHVGRDRSLLAETGKFSIVGEAADGAEAVRLVEKLGPEVVLMDVAMPRLNGIEATRQIRAAHPQTRIVILSMHADRQYIFESLRAGASGYLLKGAEVPHLIAAIEHAAQGRTYLSPQISEDVLVDLIDRVRTGGAPSELDKLSAREREVLQLIAESRSSTEIARALHVSVFTVNTHRRNIMDKLDIRNKVDLVKFALRHGLSSLE